MAPPVTRVSTTAADEQADAGSSLADPLVTFGPDGSITESSTDVFSPDGTAIVFQTTADNLIGSATSGIVTKNLVSGVVTLQSGSLQGATDAHFSPDGSAIVFEAADSSGNMQVYEKSLSNGQTSQISNNDTKTSFAAIEAISTDGSRVAYSADISATDPTGGFTFSSQALFVKTAGASQPVQIGDATSFGNATFTPDLREALYVSESGDGQLYIEDTATGVKTLVSSTASGMAGNGHVDVGFIAPKGDQAVFSSSATNLDPDALPVGFSSKIWRPKDSALSLQIRKLKRRSQTGPKIKVSIRISVPLRRMEHKSPISKKPMTKWTRPIRKRGAELKLIPSRIRSK